MKKALKDLFASKKFLAALTGGIIWVAGKVGFGLSAATVGPVGALLAVFIVGQGIADTGKEKAKIEAGKD